MTDFYCPSCKATWNGRYNTTHRCATCNTPVRAKASEPKDTWIRVEDRLPEGEVCVICSDGQKVFEEFSHLVAGGKKTGEITHWMPLPAPPGGDR